MSQNKIVLMTIHQPRTDILEMFDKIALLSVGRIAFFGPLDGRTLMLVLVLVLVRVLRAEGSGLGMPGSF